MTQKFLRVSLHCKKRIFRGTNTSVLAQTLTGSRLIGSRAHGKQMLFQFTKKGWLGLHLGMTGELRVEPSDFSPLKHDHLVLRQKHQSLIFRDPRQFGRVVFHCGPREPAWWSNLPARINSPQFTFSLVKSFLQRHGKLPIKAALLLQKCFPGIGNWMADEILWQAKINPRIACGKLNDKTLRVLFQKICFVSQQAIKIVGKDFSDLPKSWLFRYRWKKKGACPRCKKGLSHATIGGRTTCWCPQCQAGSNAL